MLLENGRIFSYCGADSYGRVLISIIKTGWNVLISILYFVLVPLMALEGQRGKKRKGEQMK